MVPVHFDRTTSANRHLREATNKLNKSHDCIIEGVQLFSRNPIFQMTPAASFLHVVTIDKTLSNLKTRYKSGPTRWNVPIASDFHRVFLREHGIENRLFGEPRRKGAHAGLPDQFELLRANRSPKGEQFFV